MPCSCGGMRRSGLAPSNVAIRQNQPKQTPNVQQYYSPPPAPAQIQRPTKPQPTPQPHQTQQSTTFQSNRPNFSGNLPRRR
jgi:hypothetical protein